MTERTELDDRGGNAVKRMQTAEACDAAFCAIPANVVCYALAAHFTEKAERELGNTQVAARNAAPELSDDAQVDIHFVREASDATARCLDALRDANRWKNLCELIESDPVLSDYDVVNLLAYARAVITAKE